MKKRFVIISLLCISSLFVACNKETAENQLPVGTVTKAPEEGTGIKEYLPKTVDSVEFIYEGEGNEYASFQAYVDFYDKDKGLYQIRVNNGGSENVDVIKMTDKEAAIIAVRQDNYYRDNLLAEEIAKENQEIILKEPLVKGTEWTLPDGRKRYISSVASKVNTPAGEFTAIEVTTKDSGGIARDYYVKGIGLIKSDYVSEDFHVTSSLSEMKEGMPLKQEVTVYNVQNDETLIEYKKQLKFYTNESTAKKMEELLKQEGDGGTRPLISNNTKINYLYLSKDNLVHVDFSKEFVDEMNAGAGFETLILQAVANTLGNYYGVGEVLLTLEGNPYESGHNVFKEGQTIMVKNNK